MSVSTSLEFEAFPRRDLLAVDVYGRRSTRACSSLFALLSRLFVRLHETQSLVFPVRRPDKIARASQLKKRQTRLSKKNIMKGEIWFASRCARQT
jgi:hypothetical protein